MSKALKHSKDMKFTTENSTYSGDGEATKKNMHHSWAKGFELTEGEPEYHPYTRRGFRFGHTGNWH